MKEMTIMKFVEQSHKGSLFLIEMAKVYKAMGIWQYVSNLIL